MARAQKKITEKRSYMRKIVSARVKIMHSAIGEINAQTRDISDSGVFVEVYPVPKLPNGAHIKMYMLQSSSPLIAFNMKVARTAPDGIGLMFIDYEVDGNRYPISELRKSYSKRKVRNNR
jgi:hypothetical protein